MSWRKRAPVAPRASDSSVAPARLWLIRAALLASTAALLGTSAEHHERPGGVHHFRRTVAGETVELTQDEPNATFLVTIRADGLGPHEAQSTEAAAVEIIGTITPSAVSNEPFVTIQLDRDGPLEFRRAFNTSRALVFEGTCAQPAANALCQASLLVELAREDAGEQGGTLSVAWSLDLTSRAEVESSVDVNEGELDPPWTVEVVKQ